MLDETVQRLEQNNHISRIKKLVFCACTNNWSNEAQQLSTVKFKSYIQQLRDRHASVVELKYLLYRIVIRLNHSTNYYTVANFLCQEMEPLYTNRPSDSPQARAADAAPVVEWGRQIILTISEVQVTDLLRVELSVITEARRLLTQVTVDLPRLSEIQAQFQDWQSRYRRLDPQNHRLMSNKAVSLVPERINDCLDAGAMLQASLDLWQSAPEFQTIRDRLATTIDRDLEVEILVCSRAKSLLRLPWTSICQPLLTIYPNAEVSVSLIPTDPSIEEADDKLQISVLSILASAQGIKLDRSKEYLDALPLTQSEFAIAPNHVDFNGLLTNHSWSVVFFSSYISGYLPNNRIYINHHDTITIPEFKYRLHAAVKQGLKLLILNCGDGLELAAELADLQIPYTIVMREAVQDQVAQEFVKLVLKAFSSGKSLQLSVREARERLVAIEKVVPAASWLPALYQQSSEPPSSWVQLAHNSFEPSVVNDISMSWMATDVSGIGSGNLSSAPPALAALMSIPYARLTQVQRLTGYSSEVYGLAFSANGQWLVSGHGDITHADDAVKVWRLTDGNLVHNLLGHSHWVYSVALTGDSETIISGSLDGTVQWWQLSSGTKLPQLLDRQAAVNAISLTSDEQRLVVGGDDARIEIWQPQNSLSIHQCQGHLESVTCVATDRAVQLIASGSSDYTVRLWHLQEGRLIRTLLGHGGRITGVAITPDGKQVISASQDGTIKIWEVASGNVLNTLSAHTKPIGCIALSPDGQTIISGGDDLLVHLWNVSDGNLIHTLSGYERPILSVAFSSDSRSIAVGSYGEIQVWRVLG